jgi:hypothetical protein
MDSAVVERAPIEFLHYDRRSKPWMARAAVNWQQPILRMTNRQPTLPAPSEGAHLNVQPTTEWYRVPNKHGADLKFANQLPISHVMTVEADIDSSSEQ